MPTLEFATINLNSGVAPDDAAMLAVLHACIAEIAQADGVSGMRFMKNLPAGAQAQILGLTGLWATAEAHAAYLHSGKLTPLLADLLPFITMGDVLHVQVGELSAPQKELLQGAALSADFRVKAADRETFAGLAGAPAGQEWAVSGWKAPEEKSFKEAEDLGREGLGQGVKEDAPADIDHWVLFVRADERRVLEEIIDRCRSVTVDVEIQSWVGI